MKRYLPVFLILGLPLIFVFFFIGLRQRNEKQVSQNTVQGKIKLTVWKWVPTEDSNQMPALKRAFENENPDIELVVNHIGEANTYLQKLPAALLSGNGPDVVALQVGAMANDYKQFLEPLKPYAEKEWGQAWRSKFLDEAIKQCAYSGDDFYILPGGMTITPAIFYNVDIFEKHGLNPPDTMEDLKKIIETLKVKEPGLIPGVGFGGKDDWAYRDLFMAIANQIAPGKIYKAEMGEIPWEDKDIVRSFREWKNIFSSDIFIHNSWLYNSYPEVQEMFIVRKIAMFSTGSWQWSASTSDLAQSDNNRFRFGMFAYPSLDKNLKRQVVSTVDVGWGMNKKILEGKKKDAAWKFIAFMTAGSGQEIWTESLQVLPAVRDLKVNANSVIKRDIEMTMEYLKNSAGRREFKLPEVKSLISEALQIMVLEDKSPEEICRELQQGLKDIND
jgi:raffinose/stachyose/melibiose transport system substrate-binding protein